MEHFIGKYIIKSLEKFLKVSIAQITEKFFVVLFYADLGGNQDNMFDFIHDGIL